MKLPVLQPRPKCFRFSHANPFDNGSDGRLPRNQSYDKKYPSNGRATDGVYHCIVGRNFASAISHETRFYIHLVVETLHVILFKSKDCPFDLEESKT